MHGRGLQQQLLIRFRQTQFAGDQHGEIRHAHDMRPCFRIPVLRRLGQAQHSFALPVHDFARCLAHLTRQPGRMVGHVLARQVQAQHIAGACQKLDLVYGLG